jgi:hypothetical protein
MPKDGYTAARHCFETRVYPAESGTAIDRLKELRAAPDFLDLGRDRLPDDAIFRLRFKV